MILKVLQYSRKARALESLKFLCLSEPDRDLLKKEAARFLQSEEISFGLLYNLHYSNIFYLKLIVYFTLKSFHYQNLSSTIPKSDIEVRGSLV